MEEPRNSHAARSSVDFPFHEKRRAALGQDVDEDASLSLLPLYQPGTQEVMSERAERLIGVERQFR